MSDSPLDEGKSDNENTSMSIEKRKDNRRKLDEILAPEDLAKQNPFPHRVPPSFQSLTHQTLAQNHFTKNYPPSLENSYQRLLDDYAKLETLNIFEEGINHKIVSPNSLHSRFQNPIHLIQTDGCKEMQDKIQEKLHQNKTKLYLHGPIGIGKSHAILAEVLRLRKEGCTVVYINNAEEWTSIGADYEYFINEILYASIPLQTGGLLEGARGTEEYFAKDTPPLFQWYCILKFIQTFPVDRRKTILQEFMAEIRRVANHAGLKIYYFSDQENVLMKKNDEGIQYGKCFPFITRLKFGHFQIISASANNISPDVDFECEKVAVFQRMSKSEISSLIEKARDIKLSEDNREVLFEACNGNPLEACHLTKDFKFPNEDSPKNSSTFSSYLSQRVLSESIDIEKKICTKYIGGLDQNKDKFYRILPYLNAQIDIDKAKVFRDVLQYMEKQYMMINPLNNYLETLTPSAAEAFRSLTTLDVIETALKTLLYSQITLSPDSVGRLLEFYIIRSLDNDKNKLQEITFSYFDDSGITHENGFSMNFAKIIRIPLGQIDPPATIHSTLYIPDSFTYPCIDLAFYNNQKKILYGIQITINLKNHKGSHDEFLSKYSERWKNVLGNDLQIQFIWIGGGWNPKKLAAEIIDKKSETNQSWTISYKQIPTKIFPLFEKLHEDEFLLPEEQSNAIKIDNLNLLMGKKLNKNTTLEQYEKICQVYMEKEFPNPKANIEIACFFENPKNDTKAGKKFNGFFVFEDENDKKDFGKIVPKGSMVAKDEYEKFKKCTDAENTIVKKTTFSTKKKAV